MGHKCFFYERIELLDNQLVYIIKAVKNDFEIDVIKYYEDGKIFVRENLTCHGLGGYYVTYPGESYRIGYSSYLSFMSLDPRWYEQDKIPSLWLCNFADIDFDGISNSRPELKYFIAKIKKHFIKRSINGCAFMRLLIQYKKYPNIETLVDLGYFKLALNNSLQRLSKKKLKEVIRFIKDDSSINQFTQLKTIFQCIKYDCSLKDYSILEKVNFDKKILKVINSAGVKYSFYYDYIKLAKKVGHDIEDEYWKYPSNLIEFHNRVLEENRIYEDSKNEINNYKLQEVLKNITKYNCNINGYDVFVSTKYSDYVYVSDELKQCLVRCDYIQRVINQKEIIVFIWKDGIPVATAEVFYDKSIGQFYGDQTCYDYCHPSEELEIVLDEYLKRVKLRKRKVNFDKLTIQNKNQCLHRMVGVN